MTFQDFDAQHLRIDLTEGHETRTVRTYVLHQYEYGPRYGMSVTLIMQLTTSQALCQVLQLVMHLLKLYIELYK